MALIRDYLTGVSLILVHSSQPILSIQTMIPVPSSWVHQPSPLLQYTPPTSTPTLAISLPTPLFQAAYHSAPLSSRTKRLTPESSVRDASLDYVTHSFSFAVTLSVKREFLLRLKATTATYLASPLLFGVV